jgi:hypothetical protein
MSGKAAVERIKSNTDPFYATGVVMMARTKEDLRPTGEVFVGTAWQAVNSGLVRGGH